MAGAWRPCRDNLRPTAAPVTWHGGESVAEIAVRLRGTGYICDEPLATMVFLAQQMQRPLLLEGEPGTGKTALAEAVAESLGLPLIRLQCYEGIDASQALYDWDFPRQILHLRALEASGGTRAGGGREEPVRRPLPARATDPGRAPGEPGRPADRRGGPRRRRVRGVPAGGALDLAGDDPRVRHGQGGHAAVRGAHLQPDPRDPRRPQTALPLPLDRPPRPRARAGDRPVARSGGLRGAGPSGGAGRPAAAHPRRPAQAARGGRDPGLGPCAGAPRHDRPRPVRGGCHAGRAGEVPRGHRAREAGPRPDAGDHER